MEESALKNIGKDIFEEGIEYLNNSVKFAVVKLKSCNGAKSYPFSKAECEFEFLKREKKPFLIRFADLFTTGVTFLEEMDRVKKGNKKKGRLEEGPGKNALLCLGEFFKAKDIDERCLEKVFNKKKENGQPFATETDITVALAEHLLKKLAPGGSYKVDTDSKLKRSCLCECGGKPTFSPTGMGNSSVWYGFIDIVFTSPYQIKETQEQAAKLTSEDIPAIAKAVEDEEEEEEDDLEDSPKMIAEVKKELLDELLQQALAQTIVFSLIQRKRHPDRSNHMMPNIVISPKKFKIMMYDAERDIFLVSNIHKLFIGKDNKVLSSNAVIVLWMVLHNRTFCTGFENESFNKVLIESLGSNFKKLVESKSETYSKSLEFFVSKFNPEKKPSLNDSFNNGCEIDLYTGIDMMQLDDRKPDA